MMIFLTGCMPSPIEHSNNNTFDRQMISRSLSNTGNTYRINKILKNTERPVLIAFTGSSAFVPDENGKSSASLAMERIKDLYKNKVSFDFVNYSLFGTSSELANIAIKEKFEKANIIFIDYAVFDGHEQEDREAFEGLVRTCLEQENEPQVIIFLNAKSDGNINTEYIEQIAKYYNLSVINAQTALLPEITSGRKNLTDIFADKNRYTEDGQNYIADFCANYFKIINKSQRDKSYSLPAAMNINLQTFNYVKAENIKTENEEPFKLLDFPNNLIFKKGTEISDEPENPYTFIQEANNIYLILQVSPENTAIAEIFINGKKSVEIDTFNDIELPKIYKVYSAAESEKIAVSVKVKETEKDEEQKNSIILYGMAFSQDNKSE